MSSSIWQTVVCLKTARCQLPPRFDHSFFGKFDFFPKVFNITINVDSGSLNRTDFTGSDKQANSDLYHICVRESSFITTTIGCLIPMSDFIENPTLITKPVHRQPYNTIEGNLGLVVVRHTHRGLFTHAALLAISTLISIDDPGVPRARRA